jgi:hypothetical protein
MTSVISLLCLLWLLCLTAVSAQEGLFGPGVEHLHETNKTDFCAIIRNETIDPKDALQGKNLTIAIQYGEGFDFFRYNPDEELS